MSWENSRLFDRRDRWRKRASVLLLVSLLPTLALPSPASTTPFADRGTMAKTGLVMGSVACSGLYTPVKAAYAAGGTVAGGLVFLMSAGQSSTAGGKMIQKTTGGDWFVRPDHLTGNRPLHFKGAAADQTAHFYK